MIAQPRSKPIEPTLEFEDSAGVPVTFEVDPDAEPSRGIIGLVAKLLVDIDRRREAVDEHLQKNPAGGPG